MMEPERIVAKQLLDTFDRLAADGKDGVILAISDEASAVLAKKLQAFRLTDLIWYSSEDYLAFTITDKSGTYQDVLSLEEIQELLEEQPQPEIKEERYYRWKMRAGNSVILSDWTTEDLTGDFVGWVRCEPGKTFEEI